MVQEYGTDGHPVVEGELPELDQEQQGELQLVGLPVERYGRRHHVNGFRRERLLERLEVDEFPLQGEDFLLRPDRPERTLRGPALLPVQVEELQ